MAQPRTQSAFTVPLQTSFLIPNLHCATCISHVASLMDEFIPAVAIKNSSTVDRVVTVHHDSKTSVSSISHALTSAGYEVFDVVLDPASDETLTLRTGVNGALKDAVERWDPRRQSRLDESMRIAHNANCQMCAAHRNAQSTSKELGSVYISGHEDHLPLFQANMFIGGMTCSSCVGQVTHALQSVAAVDRADVSLVAHSADVHFWADDAEAVAKQLTTAVDDAGYDAQLMELKLVPNLQNEKTVEINPEHWQATYTVEGISCGSCVGKISTAIRRLSFVVREQVSLVAHSCSVVFADRSKEHLILCAIAEAGYRGTLVVLEPLAKHATVQPRTVSLRIDGMHCPQCPTRIVEAAQEMQVEVQKVPTLESPIIIVSYVPDSPKLTIRRIVARITDLDPSFNVTIYKPLSVEERTRKMLRHEQSAILWRALLAIVTAIPTLVISVVYTDLVSKQNIGVIYLMQPLHGVSRAEWASFVMATIVYFFAADHFHRRTLKEIYALWRPRSPVPVVKRLYRFGSMNMLISLGTTIAYFSSVAEMIVVASQPAKDLINSSKQSYFDSVVFLTMFLLLGRLAEAHMKAKSGDAIAALGRLRPAEASLVMHSRTNDSHKVEKVNVDVIDTGDEVKIPHGSSPPCDGILLDDSAAFDESSLTGESREVEKQKGDRIFCGTINKGSAITIRVTDPAGTSMLDSIIHIVREGQTKRAQVERVADLLTAHFVPVVVLIAITTWMTWLALGLSGTLPLDYLDSKLGGWPFWSLQFAIAVFVIACPCGLGLAAPTALFVGSGMAAKHGILAKGGGEAFQEASNLDAVVFDKTGTLTDGTEPKVVQHRVFGDVLGLDTPTILGMLKSLEENSSHPLARAAISFSLANNAAAVNVVDVEELAGKGLRATAQLVYSGVQTSYEVMVGNEALLQDYGMSIPQESIHLLDSWKIAGYSVMLFVIRVPAGEWKLGAILATSDPVRVDALEVVKALQVRGIDVWMLSGDNPKTAQAVGRQVGILPDKIIAGVLPAQKADKIKYLQQTLRPRRRGGFWAALSQTRSRATIAMVGDGINDVPALAAADVGIAVASGSDVAVQSASFVLLQSDLRTVLTLVTLSRAVFRRVVLNFFWALLYNIIALPVAAGVLYPIVTSSGSRVRLDPVWAALAMALSSICVVASSLLLRTRIPMVGYRE